MSPHRADSGDFEKYYTGIQESRRKLNVEVDVLAKYIEKCSDRIKKNL
jgi:riboflavin synthase alpha subunit